MYVFRGEILQIIIKIVTRLYITNWFCDGVFVFGKKESF